MEVEKKILKKELNLSETLNYFIDHIESQCTLGKVIIQNISFQKGQFFILIPENANLEQLYHFSSGGINPVISTKEIHYVEGREFIPNKRITTFQEVSEFIKHFLDKNKECIAICEDATRSKGDSHIELPNIGIHFYEDQVYYSLSHKNSLKDVYKIVRRSDNIWHSLMVLTKCDCPHDLTMDDFLIICKNAQYILTSAHDSENCIFWEKISQRGS